MTNIPSPTFTSGGFLAPSVQSVLDGAQADIDQAFGGNVNPALNTPQGQIATSWAATVSDKDSQFVEITNMMDPAYASGRYQDAIGRIYFITRKPAIATIVEATCVGGQGVSIPQGSLAQAQDGNIYTCTDGGTIDATGSIILTFACNVLGPITCPAGSLTIIYRAIPGWDTVNNQSDGILGQNVESRAEFEARRAASVAINAQNSVESVLGNVLNVANVLDAYAIDNQLSSSQTIGGVTLVANSLLVTVSGGADLDVATAIWQKKAPGCNYNGNTTVSVVGSPLLYVPPLPTWNVTFLRPNPLPVMFSVVMLNNSLVPSDAVTQIQNAIIGAFAGADGGTRARIGSTILALRYASAIIALGSWAQMVSIQVGSYNTPVVTFTGSITGTALTATSQSPSASIAMGQTITDGGLNPSVLPGTTIVSGSGGSWVVSLLQAVASVTMYGVLANRQSVAVNINEVPTINANNIAVTFQ